MDKFDRIFQLHAILAARKTPIALEDLTARLECSKSTLYRAIGVLKDRLHAPVEFDAGVGGFRYATSGGVNAFELPGLWFTATELQALALMQRRSDTFLQHGNKSDFALSQVKSPVGNRRTSALESKASVPAGSTNAKHADR